MKRFINAKLSLLAPLALLPLAANAKPAGHMASAMKMRPHGLTAQDSDFLKKVNGANLAEAGLTPVALKNSTSPSVRKFAQHMVMDHMKANDAVKGLAAKKGVTLPGMPPADARAKAKMLKMEKGKTFDADYRTTMISDHHKAIALFETEVKKGSDPEVKAFAAKTLPTLHDHLSMAQALK